MNQDITFYWNIASQPARAVKALLDIGKINVKMVEVSMPDVLGGKFTINPMHKIPFLTHGNVKISQSNAIMIYLCQIFPSIPQNYYGQTAKQRAITNQFLSWYQNIFRPALFKIIKIKFYGALTKKIPFHKSQIITATKEMFEVVEDLNILLQKSGGTFICGNYPTIADLLIFFELTNFVLYGQSYEKYTYVDKWFKTVYKIPEVMKITHLWYPLGQKLTEQMKQIKPSL